MISPVTGGGGILSLDTSLLASTTMHTDNNEHLISVEDNTGDLSLITPGEPVVMAGLVDNLPSMVEDNETAITDGGTTQTQPVNCTALTPSSGKAREECVMGSEIALEEDILSMEDDNTPVVEEQCRPGNTRDNNKYVETDNRSIDTVMTGPGMSMKCDINKRSGHCRTHRCNTTKYQVSTCRWGWRPKLKSFGNIYGKTTKYYCNVGKSVRAGTTPSTSYVPKLYVSASLDNEALGQSVQFESESESVAVKT